MKITNFEISNRSDTYFVSYDTEFTKSMEDNKVMTKQEILELLQKHLCDYSKGF